MSRSSAMIRSLWIVLAAACVLSTVEIDVDLEGGTPSDDGENLGAGSPIISESLSPSRGSLDDPPEPTEAHRRVFDAINEAAGPQDCESPYGTPIGEANGVVAFSNCNSHTISFQDNHVAVTVAGSPPIDIITGMKWQCVEYARRYLLHHYGNVFDDVAGAIDIWKFTSVHAWGDYHNRVHFGRYKSFDAETIPAAGSLIVYPVQKDMPYGHVAVIVYVAEARTSVDTEKLSLAELLKLGVKPIADLRIGEQNYDSRIWKFGNYARTLLLVQDTTGFYGVIDGDGYRVLGWMTVERDIKPLDAFTHDDSAEEVKPLSPRPPSAWDNPANAEADDRAVSELEEEQRRLLEEAVRLEAEQQAALERDLAEEGFGREIEREEL